MNPKTIGKKMIGKKGEVTPEQAAEETPSASESQTSSSNPFKAVGEILATPVTLIQKSVEEKKDKKVEIKKKLENYPDVIKLLMEFPTKDAKDTALHVACQKGYSVEIIKSILDCDADAAKKGNSMNELAMHSAAKNLDPRDDISAIEMVMDANKLALMAQSNFSVPYKGPVAEVKEEEEEKAGFNLFVFLGLVSPPVKEEKPSVLVETKLTPLHTALLLGGSSDVVDLILEKDPSCLNLPTSQGRTALQCGEAIIKASGAKEPKTEADQKVLSSLPKNIQNTIASINSINTILVEMKSNEKLRKKIESTKGAFSISSGEAGSGEKRDPKLLWKKAIFASKIISKIQKDNILGKGIPSDFRSAPPKPDGFELPGDLEHVGVDETLPVGYKRLRWCLLNNQCKFMPEYFYEKFQDFKKVKFDVWDSNEDHIGLPEAAEGVDESTFVGAKKKIEYLFPKSIFCGASMAYEDVTILAYNDYCFSFRKSTSVPEVPFGSTFNAIVQMTVVNMGFNQSKIICSVEPEWLGKQPLVGRQIRNALRTGCTYYFTTLGEELCNVSNPFADKKETRGGW